MSDGHNGRPVRKAAKVVTLGVRADSDVVDSGATTKACAPMPPAIG